MHGTSDSPKPHINRSLLQITNKISANKYPINKYDLCVTRKVLRKKNTDFN